MSDSAIQRSMQLALEHHQAGRLAEAEAIYRQVIAEFPDHADALHLLGVLAGQAGHADRAIDLIGRAIAINPAVAQFHGNLGEAYRRLGQLDPALDSLNRAIELRPDLTDAHFNLGHVLSLKSRAVQAMAAFQRAIELRPDHAEAYYALGNLLKDEGRHEEAIATFTQLIRFRPEHAQAHNNLGVSLHASGRLEEAISAFARTIQLKPDRAQAYSNLGVALRDSGRVQEARTAFQRAIDLNPSLAKTHVNLGALLLDLGHVDEGTASLRRAIDLQPDLAEAHFDLGIALYRENRLDEAIDAYRRAIKLKPDNAEAYCGLGVASLVSGQVQEASRHFDQALLFRPDYVIAHSNLVMCEQYRPEVSLASLARSHAEWDRRHASHYRASWRPWILERDSERPLRIGFVSADFRRHAVGFFLAPVLEHLDRRFGAVVCYNNRAVSDDLTRRIAAAATEWRDVFRLNDDALADQIRADRVDLLVDLSGHTEGNRLLVFARRPAPIQLTWIGYAATTGMTAMDYLIADRFHVPPELETHYKEKILRMPDSYVCFDPPVEAPAVGPLPAQAQGTVTLGSFNNLAKLNAEVIATWAEIVRRIPGARLSLVTRGLGGAGIRNQVREAFVSAGVDPHRVKLQGKMPRSELLAAYNAIDLALDPFPYSGGVTACEALWMGVPVVTCPGETFASRHSLSHLTNVGLTETIATDRRAYIELAVRLAQDLPHLAELRASLREQVLRSPICDGARFAKNLMALMRDVWREWCHQ
jgi:predicted O-linked N-acetylglucosamine transferase (SPINDLY family)